MKKFIEFFCGSNESTDDLITFFYHVKRHEVTCATYLKDAEKGGDKDLVEFFKEVQAQDRLRAFRAEELLKQRTL